MNSELSGIRVELGHIRELFSSEMRGVEERLRFEITQAATTQAYLIDTVKNLDTVQTNQGKWQREHESAVAMIPFLASRLTAVETQVNTWAVSAKTLSRVAGFLGLTNIAGWFYVLEKLQ